MDDRLSESEACECESVDLTEGGGFQIGRDRPVRRSVRPKRFLFPNTHRMLVSLCSFSDVIYRKKE